MVYVNRICVLLLFLPIIGSAQGHKGGHTFVFEETELERAILEVASTFKQDVIFDAAYFESEENVSLTLENLSLKSCLDQLLAETTIKYELSDGEILLKKYRTIYGYIRNSYDHEALVGANVYDARTLKGVSANDYGFFSLKIPYETSTIKISYIGFQELQLDLNQVAFPVNILLKPEEFLDQIIITPLEEDKLLSVTPEENNLLTREIDNRFSTGGEPDINQYLYTQSGVSSGPDGIGGLHVRGGNIDQNLILLDGVQIFQPNHAFGLFSVFNTSLLNSARFSKYNFHPKHSGGVSSVVDMKLNEGSKKSWGGNFSVSTLATQVNFNGPIWKERTSILFSARRSHINPLLQFMSRNNELEQYEEEENRYSFYDTNFKLSHKINDRNSIHISHYAGRDGFENDYRWTIREPEFRIYDSIDFRLKFGNIGTSVRYNHIYGDKMFSNTTASYSRFRYQSQSKNVALYDFPIEDYYDFYNYDLNFFSKVEDLGLRHDMEYFLNDKTLLTFGAFFRNTAFQPGAFDDSFENTFSIEGESDMEKEVIELISGDYLSNQGGIYYNNDIYLSERFLIQSGFNYSLMRSFNKELDNEDWFHLFQARLALRSQLNQTTAFQLTFDKNQQPFHILTSTNIGFPNDVWVPATGERSPQNAYQANLRAIISPSSKIKVESSIFYKYLTNLIRYPDEFSLPNLSDRESSEWEEITVVGDGLGRGFELDITLENEWMNASLAYTLSKYERRFDALQKSESFPFEFDQNHNLSLNLLLKLSHFAYFYTQFQYNRGGRQSLWNTTAYSPLQTPLNDFAIPERRGDLNDHRLPDYHRLDLGFIFEFDDNGAHQFVLGVQNVYNRRNVYFQYYRVRDEVFEQEVEVNEGLRSVYALPILPTFRYSYSF